MKNLPQNPASGGMPARDNRNMAMPTATGAERSASPAKSVTRTPGASRDIATTTAKAPRFITA